jgi:hypothetical protein
MKLNDASFQTIVKVGGFILAVSVVANVYILLRHREVYRDASRVEVAVQQQGAVLNFQLATLEAIIREFGNRASNDPGIAAIFQHYQATNAVTTNAVTTGAKP